MQGVLRNNCIVRRADLTCYENMAELKAEFLDFAFEYYSRLWRSMESPEKINPYLLFSPLYIEFAKEETPLFQLLFVSDMDLDMSEANDFYRELGNEEKSQGIFADDRR